MTRRENILRAIRFDTPDYIPMTFHINAACWHTYPQDALLELMSDHHFLFPDFDANQNVVDPLYAPNQHANQPYTDDWGCVWKTTENGITGSVTGHPLEHWDAFDGYIPPNPVCSSGLGSRDWEKIAADIKHAESTGELLEGGLNHGHTFLILCDLRGYQNTLYDMIDEDKRLNTLIRIIEDFNTFIICKFLELGVDLMNYPEDLGMQIGPMLSPPMFCNYIKPSYQRLMEPSRKAGVLFTCIQMEISGNLLMILLREAWKYLICRT